LQGATANDERDRRDELVKQLGDKINIRYAEGKNGALTITAGNTAVIVSAFSSRDLSVASTPAGTNKAEGNVDIFYKATDEGTPIKVTQQLVGGEIGGLLNVRDDICNGLIGDMDHLAHNLALEVNRAHVQGYDRSGKPGDVFFEVPPDGAGATFKIKLADEISENVGLIAAAGQPGAPGDNRVANLMSSLEYRQTMDNGTATFNDFYGSIVGQVGIEAQRANTSQEAQKDIVGQLKNLRESVSGVSLDEETTRMIEFQKSFEASARLVKAADEMMDTVLNLKRL
jgi:flagellar hook-associated protein 1